jgi:hypothetical protein
MKDDSKISSILSAFLSAAPAPAHLIPKGKSDRMSPAPSLVDLNATVAVTANAAEGKIFDAKQVIITLSNAGYIGEW